MSGLRILHSFQGQERSTEFDQDEVVLGRPRPDVQIDLDLSPDLRVSRPHARLRVDDQGVWIEDLGSTYGTLVNHREIKSQGAHRVMASDTVVVGETRLQVSSLVAPTSFDVWFSYNHADRHQARTLRSLLASQGIAVWMDEYSLQPGKRWRLTIEDTIQQVRSVAVLVGPHGIGPFQNIEIECAISQSLERGTPLIPVLLPGAVSEDVLGPILKTFQWLDLRTGLDEARTQTLARSIRGSRPSS